MFFLKLPTYQNYQISIGARATNYQTNINKPNTNYNYNNNSNKNNNNSNSNNRAQAVVCEKYQKNLKINTKSTKNIPSQKTSANQTNKVKPQTSANRLESQPRNQFSSDENVKYFNFYIKYFFFPRYATTIPTSL